MIETVRCRLVIHPETETSNKMKKRIAALVLGVGLLGGSCIGTNAAFNGIHGWNEDLSENKWANAGVHLAFVIIPVYGLALLGDYVIFNTIEFWGGNNPIGD